MSDKHLCANCDGEGWVCEDHPEVPWGSGDGCCGGAGMPCICNPLHKYEEKGNLVDRLLKASPYEDKSPENATSIMLLFKEAADKIESLQRRVQVLSAVRSGKLQ